MSSSRTQEQIKKDNDTRLRRSSRWVKAGKKLSNVIVIKKKREDDMKLPQAHATNFIFWWIAFESLFASWKGKHKEIMQKFIHRVVSLDEDNHIADVLEQESKTMLKFVKLRATHLGLWKKLKDNNGNYQYKNHNEWERVFNKEMSVIKKTEEISQEEVLQTMEILFERLCTVRNQVFHGANSLADSHGSSQVRWGANLLSVFVPIFLKIVKKRVKTSPSEDWGEVSFPRIGERDQKNIRPSWAEESD